MNDFPSKFPQVWDGSTGTLLKTINNLSDSDISSIFVYDRKLIYGNSRGTVGLMSTTHGRLIRHFAGKHGGDVTTINLYVPSKAEEMKVRCELCTVMRRC
jgi:hypothetical protein